MKLGILISKVAFVLVFIVSPLGIASAQDGATIEDVYELILKGVPVVQELGEQGLPAFNDPNGEFVLKDAYVLVLDCSTMQIVAHPNPKLIGLNLKESKDMNPDPAKVKNHGREMCEKGKLPNGAWLEYFWTVLGTDKAARKVGFVIGVPGTPYVLVSSIYDDESDIDKLNASLK